MTAADENTPQTAAGKQAADDKAAAGARIREQAEKDQREAAEAEAAAQRKREQTAAAREARQRRRAENSSAQTAPDVDQAPAAAQPCEGCREGQEQLFFRLGNVERQVQAIGKLVATGVVAGLVVWFLSGREKAAQAAALEGAPE